MLPTLSTVKSSSSQKTRPLLQSSQNAIISELQFANIGISTQPSENDNPTIWMPLPTSIQMAVISCRGWFVKIFLHYWLPGKDDDAGASLELYDHYMFKALQTLYSTTKTTDPIVSNSCGVCCIMIGINEKEYHKMIMNLIINSPYIFYYFIPEKAYSKK